MDDVTCLMMGEVGSQTGAPYSTMGLIRESKSVVFALKDILDLSTVLFNPKNARLAQTYTLPPSCFSMSLHRSS